MDIDEINEHIRKLKCEETSWQSVNKLAALCTVRDEHMNAIKLAYPKEYELVMRKISNL